MTRYEVFLQLPRHREAQVQLLSFAVTPEFPDTAYVDEAEEAAILSGNSLRLYLTKLGASEGTRLKVERLIALGETLQ